METKTQSEGIPNELENQLEDKMHRGLEVKHLKDSEKGRTAWERKRRTQ